MLKRSIEDTPAFTAGDLTRIREVLHPKNEAITLPFSLAFATLEPGQASQPHILQERSETYIIVSGSGIALVDEVQTEIKSGDVIYIPAGARQYVRNTGKRELAFWCIVAPPWSANDELVF
ncbi:MAG: cupin domain-containing protein [Saprospiraceae bacterium]|nr:cupin domain-containing protein [Lewinella sp.]